MLSFPSRPSRGSSLATVMMVVAMMMTLAFTVVAIAFNHLNLSFKNSNSSRARHLAEATLSKTIDSIKKDQQFGKTGSGEARTVRVVLSSLPAGSEGVLSFDQAVAASAKVPYSTNNQTESAIQGVENKVVPGESFHLVAKGQVKNSTALVEAVVIIPRFPYSVASEGAIRSDGGLVVAAVRPGVPYDLDYPLHEDDLEPGHLVSNSKLGDGAVVLDGENRIFGDVQSASGVTLANDTQVLGEVRTGAQPESLPEIVASDYDPELEQGLQTVNSGAGQLDVVGYNKSYSSLTVDNGVRLNGGVLFVEGDLTVSAGGVSGKGAVIATGDIRISGDGDASSDNQAALIADGDIILTGASHDKAKFAGLIFTNGQLKAKNLRLAGVFVAAGNDSDVDFENTEVYQDVSKAKIDISSGSKFTPPPVSPPSMSFEGRLIEATYDSGAISASLTDFENPNAGAGETDYVFKIPFAGSSTGYITHQFDSSGVSYVETPGPDQFVIDGSTFGLKIFGQTVTSEAEAEDAAVAGLVAQFAAEGRTLTAAELGSIRSSARLVYASTGAAFSTSQASAEYSFNNSQGGGGAAGGSDFRWSLDLSDFYNRSDYMRVLYWADFRHG